MMDTERKLTAILLAQQQMKKFDVKKDLDSEYRKVKLLCDDAIYVYQLRHPGASLGYFARQGLTEIISIKLMTYLNEGKFYYP